MEKKTIFNLDFDEFLNELNNSFPTFDYDIWKAEAEKSLKGKPLEKLISKTFEQIDIHPLFYKFDENVKIENEFPGFYSYLRGTKYSGYKQNSWDICLQYDETNPQEVNKQIIDDFKLSPASPILIFKNKLSPNGIEIKSKQDFFDLLTNFEAQHQNLYLKFDDNQDLIINSLRELLTSTKLPNLKAINLLYDPLRIYEISGNIPENTENFFNNLSQFLDLSAKEVLINKNLNIDAHIYNNAGANAVQEIAFAISKAVYYLKNLVPAYDINKIAERIIFSFGIGQNFFIEIAKFRAFRRLWAFILEKFNANSNSQKSYILANSTLINKSILDIHNNILRNTLEALSAILGSCDAINLPPFNNLQGKSNEFSRRLSKNIQYVLLYECGFNSTIDPVAGSYFVENLTEAISQKAYKLFQEIEAQGGFLEAFSNSVIQNKINEIANQRLNNLLSRKDILVGINKYPNIEESIETTISQNQPETNQKITPIKQLRLAEKFEELRLNSQKIKAKNSTALKVFLGNFGTVSQYKARADFSYDFMSVGGFEVVNIGGFNTKEDLVKSFLESEANIIIFCSSDELYPQFVSETARLIKRAKPFTLIILAGYPENYIEEFKQAGVDEFIHIKANIFETLSKIQEHINI